MFLRQIPCPSAVSQISGVYGVYIGMCSIHPMPSHTITYWYTVGSSIYSNCMEMYGVHSRIESGDFMKKPRKAKPFQTPNSGPIKVHSRALGLLILYCSLPWWHFFLFLVAWTVLFEGMYRLPHLLSKPDIFAVLIQTEVQGWKFKVIVFASYLPLKSWDLFHARIVWGSLSSNPP